MSKEPDLRRPDVPPEQTGVNVRRQAPERPHDDGGGDENAYAIDPQAQVEVAPDEADTGPVADRAEGEQALWDRQQLDPEDDPDAPLEDGDDVEINRPPR
jgi:hypothetical protein